MKAFPPVPPQGLCKMSLRVVVRDGYPQLRPEEWVEVVDKIDPCILDMNDDLLLAAHIQKLVAPYLGQKPNPEGCP